MNLEHQDIDSLFRKKEEETGVDNTHADIHWQQMKTLIPGALGTMPGKKKPAPTRPGHQQTLCRLYHCEHGGFSNNEDTTARQRCRAVSTGYNCCTSKTGAYSQGSRKRRCCCWHSAREKRRYNRKNKVSRRSITVRRRQKKACADKR